MKKLLALLLLSGVAFADDTGVALKGTGLRLIPLASAPSNCTTGRVCLWYDSIAAKFKLHLADGSDALMGTVTSVTGSGPISGTITGTGSLSCPTCAVTSGSYADPAWITSIAGSKITGAASIAESIISGLTSDLAAKAATTDNRFSPTPSTANNIIVDNGSAYVSQARYPTVTGETGVTNTTYPVGDVRRYGAVGDWNGSTGTDNRAFINNAIQSAAAIALANTNGGNAVVRLPCGAFKVLKDPSTTAFAIQGASNVTIEGQGECSILYGNIISAANYTNHILIGAAGSYTDFPALGNPPQNYPNTRIGTNTIALGSTTITANPTGGFSNVLAGDWIEVTEGASPKWDYKVDRVQVLSVSGDTITLTAPIDINFSNESSTGVGIFRWSPVKNFWIKNLKIQGNANTYGPTFQETEGGGLDGVTVDSTGWTNPFWYANDTDHFTLHNVTATTGVFGGFNRASHGAVENSVFSSIGAFSVEFGQGEIYSRWSRNQFLGCKLPSGNGALIGGSDTWFNVYDQNTIACDGTIAGILQIKGTTGTRFTHNIVSVGGTASYIINVGSSDGTNSGIATQGMSISDNTFYFDTGAGAPALGGVIYLTGNPQIVSSVVRGNRLIAPSAVTPFIKIATGTTMTGSDIYGNIQTNGTLFGNTFAAGLTTPTLTAPQLNITTTPTVAVSVQNTTAATSGVTVQDSPMLEMLGHRWQTTTPRDESVSCGWMFVPNSGSSASIGGKTTLVCSINGSAYSVASSPFTVDTAGAAVFNSTLTANSSISSTGASNVGFYRSKRTTVNDAAYTVLSTDYLVAWTAFTADRTITLAPNLQASSGAPDWFVFENETGNAHTLTISMSSGNINGGSTVTCTSNAYGGCKVYCNATNCFKTSSW